MDLVVKDFTCRTINKNYSWDEGVPTSSKLVSAVALSSTTSSEIKYVGYAPTTIVSFSASIIDPSPESYTYKRVVSFGDYYNTETNIQTSLSPRDAFFCHTYIMPGEYTVTIEQTEYIALTSKSEQYIYREDGIAQNDVLPHEWRWQSFFCNDPDKVSSLKSYYVTWDDCMFQSTMPTTWKELANSENGDHFDCPCIPTPTVWNWSTFLSANFEDETKVDIIKWKNYSLSGCAPTTWKRLIQTSTAECEIRVPPLSAITVTRSKELFLKVLENPPVAYIEIIKVQSSDESPYTVQLSPRKIRCGSFPIEKLVWDFGDGTPLVEQIRGEVKPEYPFKWTNSFDYDQEDPRNYDIIHTYKRTEKTGNCFYPSITAFAASTDTYDCASAVVGPIKYETQNNVSLLQNKLLENGRVVYTGQVNNNAVMWLTDENDYQLPPEPSPSPTPTPSITPSPTPSITPSSTPSITPSPTPSITPSSTPVPECDIEVVIKDTSCDLTKTFLDCEDLVYVKLECDINSSIEN